MNNKLPARFLISAALLCGTSALHAQSAVSIFGLVDVSVGRTQAPGAAGVNAVDSGRMTTSFIGFRGSEDLGGGLSANFSLEHFLRMDSGAAGRFNGDPFWARSAWVGVSSPYGTVNFGRNTTSLFVQTLAFNAFGDSFGFSPSVRHYFSSGTTTGDTAWSDSVRYLSPRLGPLSFTAHVAAGENDGGRNEGFSAQYVGGPAAVSFAWQTADKGAAVNDTRTWQLAGSWDFTAVKLFAQYGEVDNGATGREFEVVGAGLSAPLGAGRALLQWGRIEPDLGARRTTLSVGYDHFISRRTDVYVVAMRDKLTATSAGNNLGIGVRHRF
jgi:predicted porin